MLQLRDYQSETISKVYTSMMTGHKRPLVVLPCGAGKTVVFAWLARQTQLKGNVVWFLVHRRELMDQTFDTFKRFEIPTDNIYIGMVATVANHPDRWPDPNLIIFDEGHHAAARTWGRITDRYPSAWIIGLTATPCRLDGKPLGDVYDDMILGVTTSDLIKLSHLAPYRYYAPAVADLAGLRKKGADFDQDQASEIMMQRAVYGSVIDHWQKHAAGMQTICYCSSIKHSMATAEAFREHGIPATHFDGETPAAERRLIVEDFRAHRINVLCNVDLVGEGFDVPDCWCCVMLRPTMSTSLFIQQSGRSLRPQPGKTAILLDHVGNYMRHGLPDSTRSWSLTDRVEQQEEYRKDGQLTVRQCEMCYFTFPTGPDVCPNCGAPVKKTRQEIKNIKDIELKEIQEHDRRFKRVEEGKARSYEDFKRIARERGYHPAWARYKARARGYEV